MTEQAEVPIDDLVEELASGVRRELDLSAPVRKFSAVLEEIAPMGRKVKVSELVDQPIIIRSLKFFRGTYGDAAFVVLTLDGELCNTVIGQRVILPKLAAVRDLLPVEATIVKREVPGKNGYYDLE